LEDIYKFKQAYNKPKHEADIKNILNFMKNMQTKTIIKPCTKDNFP